MNADDDAAILTRVNHRQDQLAAIRCCPNCDSAGWLTGGDELERCGHQQPKGRVEVMIRPAVLGIDPSQTAAGIAVIAGGPEHINWPVVLRDVGENGHRADPWPRRARRIVAQVRRIITVVDEAANAGLCYTLAVVEGPAYANRLPSQFDRAGVFWGLVSALDKRNVPIAVIPPTSRAMFATGKGHADKKLVLAETKALWRESAHDAGPVVDAINNDNRADALTLATMGAMHLQWTVPFTTRRRHVENIAKCDWPKQVAPA